VSAPQTPSAEVSADEPNAAEAVVGDPTTDPTVPAEAPDEAPADGPGEAPGAAATGETNVDDAAEHDAAEDDAGDDDAAEDDAGDDLLVREGDVAGDYLERLLDILDMDGDIDLDVEGDRASVAIVGGKLDDLIGSDGAVLDALQELTRLAVSQSTGVRSRLMLDVGGYRARRRAHLSSLAGEAARRVAQSRQPERLSPMNPFERKVVHDVIAAVEGVRSESEGEEPTRRVVVLPER
jgi:spoIIIJ-associated protein